MEYSTHSENNEKCKLSLPEGLKNLMYDISREVLRAQPSNLYQFIADYLSALLIAREKLNVANHLCEYICNTPCQPELHYELRNIGLTEEEVTRAQNIIYDFLQKDEGAKGNFSVKLMEAKINKNKIASIKEAVERAYKQKISKKLPSPEIPSSYNTGQAKKAAANTLKLYWKPLLEEERTRVIADGVEAPVRHERHNEKTHTSNQKSSTESFDKVLRTIQYDGGIQDLYVSSNRSPYKNSSLTSLAGSYGLAKCKEHAIHNVQQTEEEHRVVFYGDDEKIKDHQSGAKDQQLATTRQVHVKSLGSEDNFVDETIISIDNEINTDLGIEEIEDVALDANTDSDSDSSVDEEIEQGESYFRFNS